MSKVVIQDGRAKLAEETRRCLRCGEPASHPRLPLCLSCDISRLERGESAADILRAADAVRTMRKE